MKLRKKEILEEFQITTNSQCELLGIIEEKLKTKQPFRVVTFNPEMLVYSLDNEEFKNSIISADAIIPDGMGLIHLLKKLGEKNIFRQPGIELSWQVLSKAIELKLPIAIIGSTEDSLNQAIKNFQEKLGNANIVYKHNGFFHNEEEESIINKLLELQPSLIFVAMPFSRQEALLHKIFTLGINSIGIGIGGSIDIWSGNLTRAPRFMQISGFEWLWRVLHQPKRIGRIIKMLIPFLKIYLKS